MALVLAEYVELSIEVREGTPGGPTRVVGGKPLCFNYTSGHRAAVRALTDGKTIDYTKIQDSHVDKLVDDGIIAVDESGCLEQYGWLGCRVFSPDGDFIGEVGSRCSQKAGHGTDHVGTGRCKFHSGSAGRKSITGKQAKVTQYKMREKVKAFLYDSQGLLGLHKELAVHKAMFDYMYEQLASELEDGSTEYAELKRDIRDIQHSIDMVGRTAERIVNMEAKTALTAAQVLYLQATVVDILNTYLEDPVMREKAAKELAKRFGTGSVDTSQLLIQASTMSGNVTR